jgi:hypothetical protein
VYSPRTVLYDDTGQLLTASLTNYGFPVTREVPSIATLHLETASPTPMGGLRAIGGGRTIAAPAAMADTLADALAPVGTELFKLSIDAGAPLSLGWDYQEASSRPCLKPACGPTKARRVRY